MTDVNKQEDIGRGGDVVETPERGGFLHNEYEKAREFIASPSYDKRGNVTHSDDAKLGYDPDTVQPPVSEARRVDDDETPDAPNATSVASGTEIAPGPLGAEDGALPTVEAPVIVEAPEADPPVIA